MFTLRWLKISAANMCFPGWMLQFLLATEFVQLIKTDDRRSIQEDLYMPTCRQDLGMSSGAIPDDAISASSAYDLKSVGPLNSRIRTERNGGAWCPKPQIGRDVYEWLEIDLGELKVITLVETQGRFGNGQGQEFTPYYLIEYQREDGGKWIRFRDRKGMEMLKGNVNTYIAEMRELRPPVIGRRIRFVPYATHPRTVCMRVEVYGCSWTDGVLSYSMRQGDRRGTEMDFFDFTYDGNVLDRYLSEGLGQLTDLEEGTSNFRLDPQNIGKKGYEWVAWKNETVSTPPVEIIFRFDHVRNFSAVNITANNMFSKDVSVFREARIFFSVGGRHYVEDPVVYEYLRDPVVEFSRQVVIAIPNRNGRFIKLVLYFASRWIMISEVRFISEKSEEVFEEEDPPPTTVDTREVIVASTKKQSTPRTEGSTIMATLSNILEAEPQRFLNDTYIGIIVGALAILTFFSVAIGLVLVCRYRRNKHGSTKTRPFIYDTEPVSFNLTDLVQSGKLGNGSVKHSRKMNTRVDSEDEEFTFYKMTNKMNDEKQGERMKQNENEISSTYQSPVFSLPPSSSSFQPSSPTNFLASKRNSGIPVKCNPTPSPNPISRSSCNDDDTIEIPRRKTTGSTSEKHPCLEIQWKDLKLVANLGKGIFGEINICEMATSDYREDRCHPDSSLQYVAVKTLNRHATEQMRIEFYKEYETMSSLHHPNIVQVLGICKSEEPVSVVLEYTPYGDLHKYLLRSSYHKNSSDVAACCPSYGCLIYMVTQIASGMKFLETNKIVHRDLAARNCLVGHQFTIKISDFGTSRSLYSTDYYRIDGKAAVPIRWMAWESVVLKKFTSKSDIWSFAVTLWEILTYAANRPFHNLSDEQVIANFGHYYSNDGQETYLPQPSNCPKEIFDLMMECWNRDEMKRPTFREIHMFLQRKNMGYKPNEEIPSANLT